MIEVARQKHKSANIMYEVADGKNSIEHFPMWKATFNKVVSVHALHWIQDKVGAVRNIYDSLKIGGECFIIFCGPIHQMLGNSPDELPYYLKNHTKWKKKLEGYVHKMYNHLNLDDTQKLFESVGFEVLEKKSYKPCENLDIFSKEELSEYLRTLLGQLQYLPQQYHTEFLQDATDWSNQNFPVNHGGHRHIKMEVIVVHAIKK
ncbi:juvenile hormone acid O-methyltransferase-like [Anneissia japonica]|uniref:juvenile hormone acid O-methyltransferase-like n=1 Tax=Anneissia japonica TaxID=1529436 RepID=UPI0014258569|nr:juvenile hormone acid O-methyltransferase-like [Anneissia japonica]